MKRATFVAALMLAASPAAAVECEDPVEPCVCEALPEVLRRVPEADRQRVAARDCRLRSLTRNDSAAPRIEG